jgi:hypothetical protein
METEVNNKREYRIAHEAYVIVLDDKKEIINRYIPQYREDIPLFYNIDGVTKKWGTFINKDGIRKIFNTWESAREYIINDIIDHSKPTEVWYNEL